MKLGQHVVRAGGDNRTRRDDLILNLKALLKIGKGHGLVVSLVDEMWDLGVGISLPFIESTGRNPAAPGLIGGLKRCLQQRLHAKSMQGQGFLQAFG